MPCHLRRIYGLDCQTYCDFDIEVGKAILPNGEEVAPLSGCLLDPKGTMIKLPPGYIRMKYINWEVYYISDPCYDKSSIECRNKSLTECQNKSLAHCQNKSLGNLTSETMT